MKEEMGEQKVECHVLVAVSACQLSRVEQAVRSLLESTKDATSRTIVLVDAHILRADRYLSEVLDFVQQRLRRLALEANAAVVYLSTHQQDPVNVDLFRTYLKLLTSGSDVNVAEEVGHVLDDARAIFLPAGVDTEGMISVGARPDWNTVAFTDVVDPATDEQPTDATATDTPTDAPGDVTTELTAEPDDKLLADLHANPPALPQPPAAASAVSPRRSPTGSSGGVVADDSTKKAASF
eukprot:CAMPEP_0170736458 /NCGR_PEP_ID=MMETSP0437-20130122/3625_1 /TAXON_ID=0 /ORGANISM="Sexangularia sp." /LENGTH=237 /DNA_ID=CAMNT_0011074821 /DNA_START=240 /DNA_END=950 /DNA_ORIENTATION=-